MGRYDWEEKQRQRDSLRPYSDNNGKWGSMGPVKFLVLGGAAIAAVTAASMIPAKEKQGSSSVPSVEMPRQVSNPAPVRAERQAVGALAPVGPSPTTSSTTQFSMCGTTRITCVVDGDTIWIEGTKIRVADIDTPEVNEPKCDSELALGNRATQRFLQLLNEGPIELKPTGNRDEDRYGRKLRVITRNGHSLGDQLVSEGLARTWTGKREPWC